MLTFQSFLSSPKIRKTLSLKPGDEGFSLIELVVVVAVLAVLSAIAIPSFTSMTTKARNAAAKSTIATIAKECAVRYANAEEDPTFAAVTLNGYDSVLWGTSDTDCSEEEDLVAESSDESKYATYTWTPGVDGGKTCDMTDGLDDEVYELAGCIDGVW
ncbi:prepilin-type N-terminal cleavage/methylation domain-containing protein [Prochlorococcus marinus]|uniref:Prepilin-type N-terminal cleavage/methylation domain-containing protein n=1 Tax=Prochlorococcus marinus XMU1408 TaxID=2213228 RepID=A0A318R0P5_PROMR|nr:prepilin-type N-terminal cleavage/methylation domain-containing protein [Prochlorococcus marinus]PYE01069.1 hypothetical protein DNJ73_06450 [Prochlorococcus marinus XMU1408]